MQKVVLIVGIIVLVIGIALAFAILREKNYNTAAATAAVILGLIGIGIIIAAFFLDSSVAVTAAVAPALNSSNLKL